MFLKPNKTYFVPSKLIKHFLGDGDSLYVWLQIPHTVELATKRDLKTVYTEWKDHKQRWVKGSQRTQKNNKLKCVCTCQQKSFKRWQKQQQQQCTTRRELHEKLLRLKTLNLRRLPSQNEESFMNRQESKYSENAYQVMYYLQRKMKRGSSLNWLAS